MKSQTAALIFAVSLVVSAPLALAQQSSLQPSQPSSDTSATPLRPTRCRQASSNCLKTGNDNSQRPRPPNPNRTLRVLSVEQS